MDNPDTKHARQVESTNMHKKNIKETEYPPKASIDKNHDGPLDHGWFSLGLGRGIKWTLWKNSVVFSRQEKQGDKWITTEELHVAPKIMKELVWRAPGWLNAIEVNDDKTS